MEQTDEMQKKCDRAVRLLSATNNGLVFLLVYFVSTAEGDRIERLVIPGGVRKVMGSSPVSPIFAIVPSTYQNRSPLAGPTFPSYNDSTNALDSGGGIGEDPHEVKYRNCWNDHNPKNLRVGRRWEMGDLIFPETFWAGQLIDRLIMTRVSFAGPPCYPTTTRQVARWVTCRKESSRCK